MPEPDTSEHVGKALKARRMLVSVSLEDVIKTAGAGHVADLKWIESADHPSTRRILWHYGWVGQAAQERGTWAGLPYAQRQQWYDTDLDAALWDTARREQPARTWWWGRGHTQSRNGAQCYVCGTWIYTYDAGRAMHNPARLALMAHRATHRVAGIPAARTYETKAA